MPSTIYSQMDDDLVADIERIRKATGIPKRAVIEATIAAAAGRPHLHLTLVRNAWTALRRERADAVASAREDAVAAARRLEQRLTPEA